VNVVRAGALGAVAVARNRNLRQLGLSLSGVSLGESAFAVALAVYAYRAGGATAVGIVGLACLLPNAVTVPLGSWFGDRHARERVLAGLALGSAAALGGCTAVYYLDRSKAAIFALAALQAALASLAWPVATALLPSLATTPAQLIAANGLSSTVDGLGTLAGPLGAGVLIATTSPGIVFGLSAGAFLWAAAMVGTIRVEGRIRLGGIEPARELLAGLRLLVRSRQTATITGLFCAQTFVRGLLSVLVVVTSFRLLHAGGGWVGYLTAAMGGGGLVGGLGAGTLAGRRLAGPFALGLLAWGIPIALLAAAPYRETALLLLALVGAGNAFEDVAGETLLQRLVDDQVLARVVGLSYGIAMALAGVGSILAPALISGLGTRGALVATGCVLPVLVVFSFRRLRQIDAGAAAPLAELELLQGVPMFAPLSVAAKEQVAARLVPVSAAAGTTIIREGDVGDRFYVIVSGLTGVTTGGRSLSDRGPGDYFGEIALLRNVPRTATITAREDTELRAVERADFIAAVTGHSVSRSQAERIVDERLATVRAT
jgi:MFS family permease